jgi:PAT family beta-lactamase induction signal transducer AmpG
VGFETLNRSLDSYFAQPYALAFLVLIVLYKLGDAFAGSLTTPFLIKGMGFSQAEVGIVIKVIGAWITIFGVIIAGFIMLRLSLFKALLIFGLLQLISNLGFWLLAVEGKNAWGSFLLPAFDIGIMAVKEASQIDYLLMLVIAFENISGGMGTAAFTVLLMSLCNQRFTATHYALLSAFAALGRIYVSPLSGVLSESWGWPNFFIFSVIMAIPGLFAVWVMRPNLLGLQKANP